MELYWLTQKQDWTWKRIYFSKASGYLPPPWDKASKNIGEVLGIIGKIAGDKSSELKKIEELEQTITEIQEELEKIEGKAERLGELSGYPVVTGEDKSLVPPTPPEGFPQSQIPGSLPWMIWQNQFNPHCELLL
jgi:hypothetical protein